MSISSNCQGTQNLVPCCKQQLVQSQQLLGSQFRTLLDQSTPDHQIQLSQSNNIVSQILNNTQNSPTRQSKTFVYRSESPIRSSQYGKNIVNVSTIQKKEAPTFVSISSTQNPIYVEKIVKVETSNTQEICILRQRINVLEQNNKTLTDELMELRHATPQQVEQIVYIENNDQLNQVQCELNQLKSQNSSDLECLRRLLKESENLSQCLQQEKDKLNCQLFDNINKLNDIKNTLCSKENQIKTLQALNDTANSQLCQLSQNYSKLQKDQQDADCLNRKISDLENYLQIKDKTIEELRGRLCSAEKYIQQLKMVEIKNGQYEQDMSVLKCRIEDLLRDIQCLQKGMTSQDQEIVKLNQTICQQTQKIQQLQAQNRDGEQFRNAFEQKSKETDDLWKRVSELDCQAKRAKQLEQNLCESERTNACLTKSIEDLNNQLNDESMRRQKAQCESDNATQEKQCLEEKLGHSGSQIDYLNQKLAAQAQEICCLLQKLQDFDQTQKQIACLENKIQFLNQQNERLKQIIAEKEQQIQKLCCEIGQAQQKANEVGSLQDQIQCLQESLNARCREIEGLRQRNAELEQSIQELQCAQSRFCELENQNKGLRQRICDLEGYLNSETCKRQQLEGDLQSLCREKQALEDKLQQLCSQSEYQQHKLEDLEKQLKEKDCQISQLLSENCKLQTQLRQAQLLADEGKMLSELLTAKLKEIECLRSKLCEAEQSQEEKQRIESKLQECEQNNSILRYHICEIENQLSDEISKRVRLTNDSEDQTRVRQQLEERLTSLCAQLEYLSKQLQQSETEILNYKGIYCQIYQIIDEWQIVNNQHMQFTQLLDSLKCKLDKKDNPQNSQLSQSQQTCKSEHASCLENNYTNVVKQSAACTGNHTNTSNSGISGSPLNTCIPNSPIQQGNPNNQSLHRSSRCSSYQNSNKLGQQYCKD